MSAPGRSQALIPACEARRVVPMTATGRSRTLMPEPFEGEGFPRRARRISNRSSVRVPSRRSPIPHAAPKSLP